jgi:site-specific recombinase XerD
MYSSKKQPYKSMKISFYFKPSQSEILRKQDYGLIYYYVMLDSRKTKEKSTFIKCHVSEWDAAKDCFTGFEELNRNRLINDIRETITKNKQYKDLFNEPVYGNEIIKLTTVNSRHKTTFVNVLSEYITEQKAKIRKPDELKHLGNIEESTWLSYGKREKNIVEFFTKNNLKGITAQEMDERIFERFDNWMVQNGRGQDYTTKHLKLIKTVLDYAKRSNIIKVNFAENYKMKHETKKTVRTLNYTDYDKLAAHSHLFTETEQKYIDVLIFMRETYLHIGDYNELREKDHFQADENGKLWIVKPRKKRIVEGRQIQMIPVSKIASDLMQKYGGIDQMPKTHQNCVNRYLKIAFAKAGIEKNVSTKLGRSSGISFGFNKKKLRGESIAFVAGWTTTRELGSYLEIDRQDLAKEFLNDDFQL